MNIMRIVGLFNPPTPPSTDLMEYVRNILSATFVVIGVLCVIGIIYGGYFYITSQGNPDKIVKAKSTILYSIIGLIVALSAFAIVQFVLTSLS